MHSLQSFLCLAIFASNVECLPSQFEERARLIQLHGSPKALNTRDRLNTRLQYLGSLLNSRDDLIIYTSITSNEECLLKRIEKISERCEEVQRRNCHEELVLRRRNIKEDCSKQEEYCFTTFSTIHIPVETAVCKTSIDIQCNNDTNNSTSTQEMCHNNTIAICSQTPQLVTITLKKQPCGAQMEETISKLCVTFPSGNWSCQSLQQDSCQDVNVTKIIATEPTMPGLECTQKELPPICHHQDCRVKGKDQSCVKDFVMTPIELKETKCDKCVEGRESIRPVLEPKQVCDQIPETFCLNVTSTIRWKKWCRPLDDRISDSFAVPAIRGLHQ